MLGRLFAAAAVLACAYFIHPFITPSLNLISAPCVYLKVILGSKVSYPGSLQYNNSLGSYWSSQRLYPSCIVSPESTEDVSKIFRTLGALESLGISWEAAIRGGGHAPFLRSANIPNGVTIDLRGLKTLRLSEDNEVLSVGGGAKWADVYNFLEPRQLGVVGGRISSVGVGGLLTGGGISFFSHLRGFACDNVVSYEVVLAGGKTVTASATQNSDLFGALKGGSNNLGVVTRFDLATFANVEMWGGIIDYDINTARQQIDAFSEIDSTKDFDPHAHIIVMSVYASGTWLISNMIHYTLPTPNPPVFQKLTSLQPQFSNTLRVANHSTLTDLDFDQQRQRQLFVTTTFRKDLMFLHDAYDFWKSSTTPILKVPGIKYIYAIQLISTSMLQASTERGGNVLGLDVENGSLVLALLGVSWDEASDDALVEETSKRFIEKLDEMAGHRGLAIDFKYLNYAAYWQNPIGGYGLKNKQVLQDVSRKYDPGGVFQSSVPGGFKLFS